MNRAEEWPLLRPFGISMLAHPEINTAAEKAAQRRRHCERLFFIPISLWFVLRAEIVGAALPKHKPIAAVASNRRGDGADGRGEHHVGLLQLGHVGWAFQQHVRLIKGPGLALQLLSEVAIECRRTA
jgi:hypothetical protein